ncbi:alpha/beta fold hydrolase [Streptomyces rubiginosohelvolus]
MTIPPVVAAFCRALARIWGCQRLLTSLSRRADVYGTSMGGRVAQQLAARHPDRVRALVLGCTSPGGRTPLNGPRRCAGRWCGRGRGLRGGPCSS